MASCTTCDSRYYPISLYQTTTQNEPVINTGIQHYILNLTVDLLPLPSGQHASLYWYHARLVAGWLLFNYNDNATRLDDWFMRNMVVISQY